MRVIVRVRPDKDGDSRSLVKILDANELIFDPKQEVDEFYFHGQVSRNRDVLRKQNKDARFTFDCVFGADSTNEQVYEEAIKTILDGFIDGYNCCVFAYGATGSGKTYTMLGTAEFPGITFLTMMELFRRIELQQEERTSELAITYLEIYNETIRDLLRQPSEALLLREDTQRGVIIPGLSFHKPKTAQELLSMLESGNRNRTQHPTDANSESSRSHAVFTVYLTQRDKYKLTTQMRIAKLSLIDLAGSERAAVVNHRGARLREGANINKSLLALGNCINALADRKTNSQHIPYRDSKLTRLLKGSLGGNCCTVMIAAVSPSTVNLEDTYNTLKYAARAKAIKNISKQNIVSMDSHDRNYKEALDAALKELSELKEKMKGMTEKQAVIETPVVTAPALDTKFKPAFEAIYEERMSLLLSQAEIVWQHSDIDLKISKRTAAVEQISQLADDSYLGKSAIKADRAVTRMKKKQDTLAAEKSSVAVLILNNDNRLKALGTEVHKHYPSGLPQNLTDAMELLEMKLQLKLSFAQIKQVQMQANDFLQEEDHYKNIMSSTFVLAKNYQLCLKRNNINDDNLNEDLNTLLKKLERLKEVSWAVSSPKPEPAKRRKSNSPNSGTHLTARRLKVENIETETEMKDETVTLNTTVTITSPLAVHEICQDENNVMEGLAGSSKQTQFAVSVLNSEKNPSAAKPKPTIQNPSEKLPLTPRSGKMPLTSSLQNLQDKFRRNVRSQSTSELHKMGMSANKLINEKNVAPNKNAAVNNKLKTFSGSKSSSNIRPRPHPYLNGKQLVQRVVAKRKPTNSSENIVPDVKFTPNTMKRLRSSKSAVNLHFAGNPN